MLKAIIDLVSRRSRPVASIRTVVCDADCLVTKPLLVGRGWATGETLLCVYIDMDIARELLNAAQNGNVVSLDVAGVCLILTVLQVAVETLLDRGAEIGTVDASGNNALHYAASNGHEQVYLPCMIRAIFLTVS